MRRYVDIIEVDRGRGIAYTAIYKEEWQYESRNFEIPLAMAEYILGPLKDGRQEQIPWPRFMFDPEPYRDFLYHRTNEEIDAHQGR